MFNQIKDLAGGEFYLITSLIMFMVFFLVVGLYLLKLSKTHINAMSQLPIEDTQTNRHEED
jgi:formate hydrogenlyase subunit 3/multisubunit Na+/H+ antiporter MnhD subunit